MFDEYNNILDCDPKNFLIKNWYIIDLSKSNLNEEELLNVNKKMYVMGNKIWKIIDTNLYIIVPIYRNVIWSEILINDYNVRFIYNLDDYPDIFKEISTDFYSKYKIKKPTLLLYKGV